MSFLPVAARELRVGARRSRLYWGRFAFALAALALSAWIWRVTGRGSTSAQLAEAMFTSVGILAMVYACLAGLAQTADSISEEKREGTMGLLFLTNLKGYDVVAGKLFSSSLPSFYGLLAILPILGVPLLLGGLTAWEYGRMALVLLTSMVFSLNLGLFVSSFCRDSRAALGGGLALMLLITVGWPGAVAWWSDQFGRVPEIWYALSPAMAMANVRESEYRANVREFWTSVAAAQVMACGMFALASLAVRRTWQDRPRAAKAGWRERWNRCRLGMGAARRRRSGRLLAVNPIYWLASRDRLDPVYALAPLILMLILWAVLARINRDSMLDRDALAFFMIISGFILKCHLASEAVRLFAEQRRSGAFELILATPLRVQQIVEGQALGLMRQFGPAFVLFLLGGVALVLADLHFSAMRNNTEWIVMAIIFGVVFVADALTIAVAGMWHGLATQRSGRAAVITGGLVLVLPWLIIMVLAMIDFGWRGRHAVPITYGLISLLVDGWVGIAAWRNLSARFRETVTEGRPR